MEPDDLDELDEAILNYLLENRSEGEPWGVGTPAVVRAALQDRGVSVPSRQTINNRMKRMELAGHLKNRYGKGEYVFIQDPRNQSGKIDTE